MGIGIKILDIIVSTVAKKLLEAGLIKLGVDQFRATLKDWEENLPQQIRLGQFSSHLLDLPQVPQWLLNQKSTLSAA